MRVPVLTGYRNTTTDNTMATTSHVKKKTLTLSQKVEVIRKYENFGRGSRRLAQDFGVGKTQIQNIIKRKREYLDDFQNNAPPTKKRNVRITGNEEINRLCWDFYRDTTSRGESCTGPMLREAALNFAKDLGVATFRGSTGWLDSFKRRHNIVATGKSKDSPVVDSDISQVASQNSVHQSIRASVDNWTTRGPEQITTNVHTSADVSHENLATIEKIPTACNTEKAVQNLQATRLEDVAAVKEESEDSESDSEDEYVEEDSIIKDLDTAIEYVRQVRLFCLDEGLGDQLFKIWPVEDDLRDIRMKRRRRTPAETKQTKMDDFFTKA